jgi:DNA-binding beta-propeller fold protein YncE
MTFVLCSKNTAEASISNIPYQTYSFGLRGDLVNTATAYEGTFILNSGFSNPEDIFIYSELIDEEKHEYIDHIYIADTGNKRVYKYIPKSKTEFEIGVGILENPTGIFVDQNQDIYVADSKLKKVFWFNQAGELIKTYDKPDEPLFGEDSPYQPRKVIVNAKKNVYVLTEGGSNGIIQMDSNGDFLGYYGVNKVQVSLAFYINRMFMSKEQREMFASLVPKTTTNFAVDQKGLIYTVIENEYVNPIKKLNLEGNNVLTGMFLWDPHYQDIFVGMDGLIYTVSNNEMAPAVISVLDRQGNLLFVFGERKTGSIKIGEFDNPVGIATDSNGDIWVLDKFGGNVQVFTKTEFANMVITAINQYNASNYEEAEVLFKEVVRQNAMFGLAHSSLGKLYKRDNNFEQALESYKIANNRNGYSDVYWELRDQWIANNIVYLILFIVGFYVSLKIFKNNRHKFTKYNEFINNIKKKKIYHELNLLKRILKDPLDVVYEIKFRQSVRIRTACILYIVFVFLNIICDYFIKGYLFSGQNDEVVLSYEILKWLIPLILIGVANHLINSLQSGEGFYRDIFIGIIYAFAPIFIFKLPLDIISNVLTYNETFIFNLAYLIMYIWTIINVILVIKEINNYKFFQLLINLVLTVFTMLIIIVLYLVINVLTNQLLSFLSGIIQEVFN